LLYFLFVGTECNSALSSGKFIDAKLIKNVNFTGISPTEIEPKKLMNEKVTKTILMQKSDAYKEQVKY
jgi:hypothetical protein